MPVMGHLKVMLFLHENHIKKACKANYASFLA